MEWREMCNGGEKKEGMGENESRREIPVKFFEV
jgi:hypothetical protein